MQQLFDITTVQELNTRLQKLTETTPALWGKMNVAQMLAHCQKPLALVVHNIELPKPSFPMNIIGKLFKTQLYNDKPYKHNLPTDKSFIIQGERNFNEERTALYALIQQFQAQGEAQCEQKKHPFFGALTADQWGKGMYKHIDHHLKQFGV